jgi:hypothetical protein
MNPLIFEQVEPPILKADIVSKHTVQAYLFSALFWAIKGV